MIERTISTLQDIMSRALQRISPESTLQQASRLMAAEQVSSLLVETAGQALGIVTETDILRALHDRQTGDTRIDTLMSQPLITAPATLDLIDARRLLGTHHIRHLIVTDPQGEVSGIVTETDFRLHLGSIAFSHLRALENVIERAIPLLPPSARLGEAVACMIEQSADYLIVIDEDKPVGIVTERDIPRLLASHPAPHDIPLHQAMSSPLRSVKIDTPLTNALESMNRFRLRHMVVLDDTGNILGVVGQRRLFEQLALEQLEISLRQARLERDQLRLEAHLKLALDVGGAGSWEYRLDDGTFFVSDGLLGLLGYPASDAPITLAAWCAWLHPDDRALFDAAVHREVPEKSGFKIFEYRIRHIDGQWLWVEDRNCIIEHHGDGSPRIFVGILQNITERRQTREKIDRQNRSLKLMSSIGQALLRYDDERQMLEEACTILVELGGYLTAWVGEAGPEPERKVIPVAHSGRSCGEEPEVDISWADIPSGQGPTGRAIRTGVPVVVNDIAIDPSFAFWRDAAHAMGYRSSIALPLRVEGRIVGAINLLSPRLAPFDDEEIALLGDVAGDVGLGLTMHRSRQTLARSERMLRQAQKIARVGHYAYDLATRQLISSPAHDEIFGIEPGKGLDKATWRELIHPDDRERIVKHLRDEVLGEYRSYDAEYRIRRRNDGVERWMHGVGQVEFDDQGHPLRLFGTTQDITEKKNNLAELENHRRHLETLVAERTEQLIQAKEDAESASRAKTAFLANISHEIRTPMNAIIGLTHLAQRSSIDAEQRQRLAKVSDAAEHLMSIINNVLDLSRIEADKLQLEEADFSLTKVCRHACELLAHRAEAKHLPIVTRIDPALPPLLRGDSLRIQQILLNFLSNAIKFTDSGRMTLETDLLKHHDGELTIRCAVSDTGIGIAPEDQERLFSPFEQADTSTTRRYGGTGLGLAICQRLASAMHGKIGVDSSPGNGATFWFTALLKTASDAPLAQASESPCPASVSGTLILLVEDNPINAEVASEILSEAGFSVALATNGAEALAMARQQHYDLVLMDMQMPEMNGIEATRQIRCLPGWSGIPILAMTANAFDEDRDTCLAAGMNDHVAKPVAPEVLLSTITRWLPTAKRKPTTDITAVDVDESRQLAGIAGLDSEFGLKIVRGRLESYLRLLRHFSANHLEDFDRLRTLYAANDSGEARRIAHSLKGLSATLGATLINQHATALEAGIKAKLPPGELEILVDNTQAAYLNLHRQLSLIVTPTASSSGDIGSSAPRSLIERLRHELQTGEIKVQELVRSQATPLRELLGQHYMEFDGKVAAFDFEGALALLNNSLHLPE